MELVYYTIGFNTKYLRLLHLSILSLRKHNSIDVMVICDECMVKECTDKLKEFKNIIIVPCENSTGAMDSSMKKLRIFDYDISKYSKVLFVDSDILVDIHLNSIFNKINDHKLYAGAEHFKISMHDTKYFSLGIYGTEDFDFFAKNNIYPFNCGLFAFINTADMKQHFSNILDIVKTHTGIYYYEQSFMNFYFNKLNLTNLTVINPTNYDLNFDTDKIPILILNKNKYRNKFFHFSTKRDADDKLREMIWWYNKFLR